MILKLQQIPFMTIVFISVLLSACGENNSGENNSGSVIKKMPLNDTGIVWGGDATSGNQGTCTSNITDANGEPVPQDCNHNSNVAAGSTGSEFNMTKLNALGVALSDQTTDWSEASSEGANPAWSCVKDNVTGLTWEVKTSGGLHDKESRFTWLSAQDYVTQVNAQCLCGISDWRLASVHDLISITDIGSNTGTVALTNYFPNTGSHVYWSGTANADISLAQPAAWSVNFADGTTSEFTDQNSTHRLRLVAGG